MSTITFKKFADHDEPDVNVVALNNSNLKPILQLWLLFTTNPAFLAQLADPGTLASTATKLNLSPAVVKAHLAKINLHTNAVAEIQATFQDIALDDDYPGVCPNSMDVITGL